jgi:pimeloyl-ACP methyl ester carboxylesterase
MAEPDDTPPRPVRRRHVLYLSGFDPQGPRQYHTLYAEEAPRQAAARHHRIEVGPRERAGPHASAWDLVWRDPQQASGDEVVTRYELLRWDDIIRQHWPSGRMAAISLTVRNSWRLLRNGSYWRFLHISWPPVLALGMPGLLVLGVVLLGFGLLAWAAWLVSLGHSMAALASLAAGGAALAGIAARLEQKLYMGWLMRSLRVVLRQARNELPALEERTDHFAERLIELCSDTSLDEVLLVGHSSGAMLAASMLARALERSPALGQQTRPAISLLTLGQCLPLLSEQPEALRFRNELARLRQRGSVAWVDFTAPADGCCAALTDPTAPALLAERGEPLPPASGEGPKLLSPRFNKLFTPATYAQVRADKYATSST